MGQRYSRWRGWDHAVADALFRALWWVGVPIACIAFLFLAVQDIGPAWSARLGGGVPGTFTAQELSCGRRSCVWLGSFTSDDGTVSREDVVLTSGAPDLSPGGTTPAVDTGDRVAVYPVGGGWDWLLVTVLLVGAAGFLVVWAVSLWRRLTRRPVPTATRGSSRVRRRDYRFRIGPERRLGGRYEVTRIPFGLTLTARGWDDIAAACAEHRVPNVVIDPDIEADLLEEWGPVPSDIRLRKAP